MLIDLQNDKVKKKGCRLFAPEHGGDYAVFDRRPLAKEILDYSTQDVIHMPNLWNVYRPKLCDAWWNKIVEETERRIKQSQAEAFDSKGKHMAEAPVGWRYWQPTPAQKKVGMLHKFQGGKAIKEKAAVPVHHTVDLADLLESMSSSIMTSLNERQKTLQRATQSAATVVLVSTRPYVLSRAEDSSLQLLLYKRSDRSAKPSLLLL
ncbi:unnamed protein product [Cercospora beticola]|nr:unnamed protein product [Cercospora beticola]